MFHDLNARQEWLDNMNAMSIVPNQVTFSTILRHCEKLHDVPSARRFQEKMQKLKVEPNKVVFNTMLNLYASARDISSAEAVFREMVRRDAPDVVAFGSLIKAASRVPDMQRSRGWMERAGYANVIPDARSYYSLLSSCAKVGDLAATQRLRMEMKAHSIPDDVVTCSTVIRACANAQNLEAAESTLNELEAISPNEFTVNAMMTACAHAKSPKRAEYWFSRLAKKGAKIELVGFNSLMANWMEDILRMQQWLKRMRSVQVDPDVITFNGLLNAAAVVCDAELANKLWSEMEEIGRPTLASYRAYSKALARNGKYQELSGLLERMAHERPEKDPMCMRALLTACANSTSHDAAVMAERVFQDHAMFANDPYARKALQLATGPRYAKLSKKLNLETKRSDKEKESATMLAAKGQSSKAEFVLASLQHLSGQLSKAKVLTVKFQQAAQDPSLEPGSATKHVLHEDTKSGSFVLSSPEKLGLA